MRRASLPVRCKGKLPQGKNGKLRSEKDVWRGFRTGVQFPSPPPKKNRNFDTMRIKVAVLSCATKALIPRGFWLLSAPTVARQSESLPPAQYAKALGSSRLSFGLWVSFNLWAIVWRLLSQSRKHHCSWLNSDKELNHLSTVS